MLTDPFTFPHFRKFRSLEPGSVSLQGPYLYGKGDCKMSHSRTGRLSRHWVMQQISIQGPEEFSGMGELKKIYGFRGKCPGIDNGNGIFWNRKQVGFFTV
jgi:hypothetical protein